MPPAARQALLVAHAGKTFEVAVKRVATARRFTLRVRSATRDAVLTMPPGASLRSARGFAERHAEWIGTRLGSLPAPYALGADAIIPLRGVDHAILHDPKALRRQAYLAADDGGGGPGIRVGGPAAGIPAAVVALLRREAMRDLAAAVSRHASAVGREAKRIVLRDTKSRWGSCSTRGTLSFSWRLVMAPPVVLDYLAAHEVAHLVHMDHSAAFWALTRRLAPEMEAAEAWLKRHGPGLHRYG